MVFNFFSIHSLAKLDIHHETDAVFSFISSVIGITTTCSPNVYISYRFSFVKNELTIITGLDKSSLCIHSGTFAVSVNCNISDILPLSINITVSITCGMIPISIDPIKR
ncbi:hypothetical protein J6V86_03795 [bacterium]|nr:hypothetical protein [bacterium]